MGLIKLELLTNIRILKLGHLHFDLILMEECLQLTHLCGIRGHTNLRTLINTKNMEIALNEPFILLSNAFRQLIIFQ